jgi:hypothetical protein
VFGIKVVPADLSFQIKVIILTSFKPKRPQKVPKQQRLVSEVILFDGGDAVKRRAMRLSLKRRKTFAKSAWTRE